jgi:hypothetical protein
MKGDEKGSALSTKMTVLKVRITGPSDLTIDTEVASGYASNPTSKLILYNW